MRHSAIVLGVLLCLFVAGSVLAGPPLDGVYESVDNGGAVYTGRYTEAWDLGGLPYTAGTTLNAESWDGTSLGSQWKYWCGTEIADGVLLADLVDGSGNGSRTYMKTFFGGYIWLVGTGPWANGDVDYPGTITNYIEFETISYVAWSPIAAISNVQASARFDNYPDLCMTFYIGNGSREGTTELGETKPTDYPGFMATDCTLTRTEGAWWDFFDVTLTITGCTSPVEEATWGNVKSMYKD